MPRRLPTAPVEVLSAPPAARATLPETMSRAFEHWRASGAHTDQTLARMSETVARFTARLEATGVASFAAVTPADARAFIDARTRSGAAPEEATRHARRTALRTFYRALRQLAVCHGDPTLDVALPPRGDLTARPLTDDEVVLCRITAQVSANDETVAVRATAWALGEATAVSSEITRIRIADLDDPGFPTRVSLPGTRRHDPRTGRLTDWGSQALARRCRTLLAAGRDTQTLLAYGGTAPAGGPKAQAAVCNALRATLHAAGVGGEPDVRPSSLRHWAGRRRYDAGAPIEAVARLLGHRSLDETASDIGLRWRTARIPTEGGR